jgi:hypothetical protein
MKEDKDLLCGDRKEVVGKLGKIDAAGVVSSSLIQDVEDGAGGESVLYADIHTAVRSENDVGGGRRVGED